MNKTPEETEIFRGIVQELPKSQGSSENSALK